ncbi:MAG: hypothetical protein ACLPID_06240 [Beijerinckiaceae bacterium]
MRRILLACLLMAATTASYGQMRNEDLTALPRASPEAATKLFSEAGYYMAVLRRCGTSVDLALFTPLLKRFGKWQKQLNAGVLAGQERANALGAFEYFPGSSECTSATTGYNNALSSIQALMALLPKR